MTPRTSTQSGAALIIVLSVLLMLLVIATPFVLSSKKDHRNAVASSERYRARAVADAGLAWARLELERTHVGVESAGAGFATPRFDDPAELMVDAFPGAWRAIAGVEGDGPLLADPRGDLWGIRVRDEQAFVDAGTAPPFVWAALLGRTTLTRDAEPSSDRLHVASTEGFPAEGGELIVGHETVTYSRVIDGAFLLAKPLHDGVRKGAWVLTSAARDAALFAHRSPRAQGGGTTAFSMPTMVKELAASGRPVPEPELDRILEPLTVWGRGATVSGWLEPTPVFRVDVDPEGYLPERGGQPVVVRDATYFNAGTVVRLTGPDGRVHHDVVTHVTSTGVVWLADPAPAIFPWGVSTLAARARQPVNVNACSKEILVLLLEGLEYASTPSPGDPEQRVSRELAEEIAEVMIANRPVRGVQHLAELMKALYHRKAGRGGEYGGYASNDARDLVGTGAAPFEVDVGDVDTGRGRGAPFTAEMAMAVVQNAINPCHQLLVGSTMPFAWGSGDVFTIESGASTNDAGGNELARHRERETYRSAPARPLVMRLDTQADFEASILAGRSGRHVETHPRAVARFRGPTVKPEPRLTRFMANFENPSRPSIFPADDVGDVRLQPARYEAARATELEEHFDGDLTGVVAQGAPSRNTGIRSEWITPEGFVIDAARRYEGLLEDSGAAIADGKGLRPFVVSFWVKPHALGNEPTFLSLAGADPGNDFVRVFWQPSDRTLRLQVHDNTVDGQGQGAFREIAEVVWTAPAGLEEDVWYHLTVHVEGTRPGQLSLHVDGFKRGQNRQASRLAAAFSSQDMSFEVEDAEGWPDEGVFWVGLELVHATRTGPNSFRVLENPRPAPQVGTDANGTPIYSAVWPRGRGARNTGAVSHRVGETVAVFGYALALTRADAAAGEIVRGGAARLASALAPFDVTAIGDKGTTAGVIEVQGTGANGQPVPGIPIRLLDLNMVDRIQLDSFGATGNLDREHEAFQESGGYALIIGLDPTTTLTVGQELEEGNMVAQVVRYERRQGDELVGLSPVAPSMPLDFGAQIGMTRVYTTTLASVATRLATSSANTLRLSAVLPISVHFDSVAAFTDLQQTGAGDRLADYVQIGAPARLPTPSNLSFHDIEWVRYTAIDRLNAMLVTLDRDTLEDAIDAVLTGLFVDDPDTDGNKPTVGFVLDTLRFRSQALTRQFGYDLREGAFKQHAAGREALPTFRISNPDIGSPSVGYGDPVTLFSPVDALRIRRHVSWSHVPSIADDAGDFAFAAFTEALPGTVRQVPFAPGAGQQADDRDLTRLLKFPSGELPLVTRDGRAAIGADDQGAASPMTIDEVVVHRLLDQRRHFAVWDFSAISANATASTPTAFPLGVDADDVDLNVADVEHLTSRYRNGAPVNLFEPNSRVLADGRRIRATSQGAPQIGMVLVGDEVIAHRIGDAQQGGGLRFGETERGFMNGVPQPHSMGDLVTELDWRTLGKLANGISAEDWELVVHADGAFAANGGAVLIDREMIHWTETAGNVLRMPARLDAGEAKGMFRGRFGTQAGRHATDALVLDMPFRYWDRWAAASDHPELAFYGVGLDEPRLVLDRLSWTVDFPKPHLEARVLCRLDPGVPWDTPVERSNGRLLLLDTRSGQDSEVRESRALGVSARHLELRVFFTWSAGAFDAVDLRANAWKETPRLLDLEATYFAPETLLRREVLR